MNNHLSQITNKIKSDPVLIISCILAVLSTAALRPGMGTLAGYTDMRTLVLLFCLMAASRGFSAEGIFRRMADMLVKGRTERQISLIMVVLCFFVSMLVTNDVALITLVPLTIMVFKGSEDWEKKGRSLMITIVLQTVAANLGSMVTPFGNPQNLYLYTFYELKLSEFLKAVIPWGAAGLVILVGLCLFFIKGTERIAAPSDEEYTDISRSRTGAYMVVLVFAIAAVLRFVPYLLAGALAVIILAMVDRRLLLKIDYGLLLTFIFFFIFAGNMGSIDAVNSFLVSQINDKEVIVSALASQLISNVPAAILLSGFTDNGIGLVLGTDIGGLGTPIASMASLISLRLYMKAPGHRGGAYMGFFLILNFVLLALMLGVYIAI